MLKFSFTDYIKNKIAKQIVRKWLNILMHTKNWLQCYRRGFNVRRQETANPPFVGAKVHLMIVYPLTIQCISTTWQNVHYGVEVSKFALPLHWVYMNILVLSEVLSATQHTVVAIGLKYMTLTPVQVIIHVLGQF